MMRHHDQRMVRHNERSGGRRFHKNGVTEMTKLASAIHKTRCDNKIVLPQERWWWYRCRFSKIWCDRDDEVVVKLFTRMVWHMNDFGHLHFKKKQDATLASFSDKNDAATSASKKFGVTRWTKSVSIPQEWYDNRKWKRRNFPHDEPHEKKETSPRRPHDVPMATPCVPTATPRRPHEFAVKWKKWNVVHYK